MEIGLDIGYGFTKVVTSNNQVRVFRSLVGVGSPDTMGISNRPLSTVSFNGDTYTVGDDAEKFKLPLINTRKRNNIESISYKVLAIAAIGEKVNTPLNIVTGLPLEFYTSDKTRVQKVFSDIYEKSNVTVIPQPAGTFFDILLDFNGSPQNTDIANKKIGIIDVGTYTTDLLLLEKSDPIRELSSTITIGIDTLLKNIIKDCLHVRRSLTHREIEKALQTGYITKHGQPHDITEVINKNKILIAKNIWSYVNSIWGAEDDIDMFVVSGGGGMIFKESFNQSNIVFPKNPFMSNVYGFYKLARRIYSGNQV